MKTTIKTTTTLIALLTAPSLALAYGDPFKSDALHPDQGTFVRPEALIAKESGDQGCSYFGGGVALGASFSQTELGFHSLEFTTGALRGSQTLTGKTVRLNNTTYTCSADSDNVAMPLLVGYTYTFDFEEATVRPFIGAGAGTIFVRQDFSNVRGVSTPTSASVAGWAPATYLTAGLRIRLSDKCDLLTAYSLMRTFSYTASGNATVGSRSASAHATMDAQTAHLATIGIEFRF